MDWIKFSDQKPHKYEKCLVCFKPYKTVMVLVYNEGYECWDDEDGDDYYCDFDQVDYWCPLPEYKGD